MAIELKGKLIKKQDVVSGEGKNGKWENAYSSKRVPNIPKDLENALKKNKLAWENFKIFSNSTKLQYIYWIENAKKDETRQKRIINVVTKAIQNIKPS